MVQCSSCNQKFSLVPSLLPRKKHFYLNIIGLMFDKTRCIFVDKKRVPILSCFFLIVAGRMAYAYIAPSTGSHILTVIIGTLASAGFAIKWYWKKPFVLFSAIFPVTRKHGIMTGCPGFDK